MDDVWFEVLVVILSIFLAIFLVLGIILLIKFIKLANTLNKITDHAERMADKAEHVSDFIEKTTTTAAMAKLAASISDSILKKGSKK